jgi:hypothetical protein
MYHPTPLRRLFVLFVLPVANFSYVLANCLEWRDSRFSYSQQPNFCYVSPNTDYRRLVVLFLLPVYPKFIILLCISKLPGVERLALFLLTSAQILLCISKLPGVERLVLFLLIAAQILLYCISSNAD